MDFDDQLRRYFGTADLACVPAEALAAAWSGCRSILGWNGIAAAASPCGRSSTCSARLRTSTWRSRMRRTATRLEASWSWRSGGRGASASPFGKTVDGEATGACRGRWATALRTDVEGNISGLEQLRIGLTPATAHRRPLDGRKSMQVGGHVRVILPHRLIREGDKEPLRLTTVPIQGEMRPESGEVDLAPYSGSRISVECQEADDTWVWDAGTITVIRD